jgi:hypothetical protein
MSRQADELIEYHFKTTSVVPADLRCKVKNNHVTRDEHLPKALHRHGPNVTFVYSKAVLVSLLHLSVHKHLWYPQLNPTQLTSLITKLATAHTIRPERPPAAKSSAPNRLLLSLFHPNIFPRPRLDSPRSCLFPAYVSYVIAPKSSPRVCLLVPTCTWREVAIHALCRYCARRRVATPRSVRFRGNGAVVQGYRLSPFCELRGLWSGKA